MLRSQGQKKEKNHGERWGGRGKACNKKEGKKGSKKKGVACEEIKKRGEKEKKKVRQLSLAC